MAPRDRWKGWGDRATWKKLTTVASSFFPCVRVNNLAISVLAVDVKRVPDDWCQFYGYCLVLLKTLVDLSQFKSTWYRAANWVYVGKTTDRVRMDQQNQRKGMAVKDIFVYPLSKKFGKSLCNPAWGDTNFLINFPSQQTNLVENFFLKSEIKIYTVPFNKT